METKIIKQNGAAEITIPDNSELLLLDKLSPNPQGSPLKINIGRNCRIKYISIWPADFCPAQAINREIYLGDKSRLESYRTYFGQQGGQGSFIFKIGAGSEVASRALFYQNGTASITMDEKYIFTSPGSRGHFSVTGLLADKAQARYYSDIILEPLAQKTDSRIDMKLYLLNPGVRGTLLPGLNIAANEVKAGHSASTFRLSPEDSFYLRSRGLNELQIKQLIIDSALSRFTAGLDDKRLQKIIEEEVGLKISDRQ